MREKNMNYNPENYATAIGLLDEIIAACASRDESNNYALGYITGLIGSLASKNDNIIEELVSTLDYLNNKGDNS